MAEIPPVRLTGSLIAVVAALDTAGGKMSTRQLAAACGLSPGTVGRVLARLAAARLVQSIPQLQEPDRPPHRLWWLTSAGRALAATHRPAPEVSG